VLTGQFVLVCEWGGCCLAHVGLHRPRAPHLRGPALPAGALRMLLSEWPRAGLRAHHDPCRLNAMNEVWVPSSWARDSFIASGVQPSKLVVVPGRQD
jgi:hypothetical protein